MAQQVYTVTVDINVDDSPATVTYQENGVTYQVTFDGNDRGAEDLAVIMSTVHLWVSLFRRGDDTNGTVTVLDDPSE